MHLQIKDLELNIKWTEILSTLPSALATKEAQKIARLFKKVIIRRKRIEGMNVEYLLDFGKRENIPPVVAKHGIKLEEPSSDRNRYWLSEGHVPLSLLKAYEAKALTRLLKKKETDHPPKKISDFKPKKPKRSGFDYLLEKAKKLASRLCGHCNKEVITRYVKQSIWPFILVALSLQQFIAPFLSLSTRTFSLDQLLVATNKSLHISFKSSCELDKVRVAKCFFL